MLLKAKGGKFEGGTDGASQLRRAADGQKYLAVSATDALLVYQKSPE
jgi:hypothetical protein